MVAQLGKKLTWPIRESSPVSFSCDPMSRQHQRVWHVCLGTPTSDGLVLVFRSRFSTTSNSTISVSCLASSGLGWIWSPRLPCSSSHRPAQQLNFAPLALVIAVSALFQKNGSCPCTYPGAATAGLHSVQPGHHKMLSRLWDFSLKAVGICSREPCKPCCYLLRHCVLTRRTRHESLMPESPPSGTQAALEMPEMEVTRTTKSRAIF